MGNMITLNRPDGGSLDAYVSEIDEARPGIVVIQEYWGLNDHIKWVADRLAAEGFNTIAPDLYHGRVTRDPDEASHMMQGLDFKGAVHEDIAAARDWLSATHSPQDQAHVGVVGFCMGGALTIACAARLPGIAAAVCFYGVPPKAFADPADIRIPFQGHFAEKDDWVTPAVVEDIRSAMEGAGQHPQIYSYDAGHAFFNRTRPEVYNPEASEKAWERMIPFFKQTLKVSPNPGG
ncbi:MAG: dienelactone hydrolase family protein [Asticcacaulis sp.]